MAYTTPLCPLMDKYGSDKGPRRNDTTHHTYTNAYHELFKGLVDRTLNVFELGLGTNNTTIPSNMGAKGRPGASLRGWREYFPQSTIYGADIDSGVLFQEERINTVFCDQTKAPIVRSMWESLPNMDIIIDDGLHTFEANVTFFENSFHKLTPTGIFIIEDIDHRDIPRFRGKIEQWKKLLPSHTFTLKVLSGGNPSDNNMLVIRHISISVCIPTMRRFSSFLKESIPRYLENPHITELVITDETGEDYVEITSAFSHPKLRVYQNECRLGVLANKQRAASYATSDFIAIIDSDNFADINYFEAFKTFFSSYSFSTSCMFLPSFAKPHDKLDYRKYIGTPITRKNIQSLFPEIETCLNTMNMIISREFLATFDILNDKPMCDYASGSYDSVYFSLYGVFNKNATLFVVDGMEYEHRVHDGSYFCEMSAQSFSAWSGIMNRYIKIVMSLETWQTTYKDPKNLIIQASSTNHDDAWMPFPIGMHFTYPPMIHEGERIQFGSHSQTVLCALNERTDERRRTVGKNRKTIVKTLNQNGIQNTPLDSATFYRSLPSYKFVISPEGNGIDCHRHYEALIAGCIPIVERKGMVEAKYWGCPILWTEDYSEITPAYLDEKYEEMKKKMWQFSHLFLEHYPPDVQDEIKRCGNYWMKFHTGREVYT